MTDNPPIFLLIKFEDYWYKYTVTKYGEEGAMRT